MRFQRNDLVIHKNRIGLILNSQCKICPWSWVDFGDDKPEWHYHVSLQAPSQQDNLTIKTNLALKLRGLKVHSLWMKGFTFGWKCHQQVKEKKYATN